MKVNLFDLNGSQKRKLFPNLALMKLSSYHKAKGDEVPPLINFPLQKADITYISCVFTWNAKRKHSTYFCNPIWGGSGLDLKATLPTEVEHVMPDYALYDINFSMGFTSRGCIRPCPWCIVPEKEGGIKPWASIYEFWNRRHRKIMLLDNNLLASPNWKETIQDLIKEKPIVDFNQGLDIRLVDEEKAYYLARVRRKGTLRFSFDDPKLEGTVRRGIETLKKAGIPTSALSFYVLMGFNTSLEEDIERIKFLASYKCEVYPMFYRDKDRKEPKLKGKLREFLPFRGSRQMRRQLYRLTGLLD